ncbi:hypothetical protein NMT12_120131 [metagenome]
MLYLNPKKDFLNDFMAGMSALQCNVVLLVIRKIVIIEICNN